MYVDKSRTYIGIVEENQDPKNPNSDNFLITKNPKNPNSDNFLITKNPKNPNSDNFLYRHLRLPLPPKKSC